MKRCALLAAVVLAVTCAGASAYASGAGLPAAQPGAVVQGCLNQTVASGQWRVRVTKVAPVHRKTPFRDEPQTGWGVSMEWTNAAATTPKRTIAQGEGRGATISGATSWTLYFKSGQDLGVYRYDASRELSKAQTGVLQAGEDQTHLDRFFGRDFPPGVPRSGVVLFWYPANDPGFSGKPTKLLISGEPYVSPHFKAVRIALTCTK